MLLKDRNHNNGIVVILKNPSRASEDVSDKTVYTVAKYIFRNLKEIGKIIVLNLMPFYETYSEKLIEHPEIIDVENFKHIDSFTKNYNKTIIAWGNNPKGFAKDKYDELIDKVFKLLQKHKNNIFYVDKFSKLGYPKHGQVWKYADVIHPFAI